MNKKPGYITGLAVLFTGLIAISEAGLYGSAPKRLIDFNGDFDMSLVETSDAECKLISDRLEVITGIHKRWPGITLRAPAGKWDLSGRRYIVVHLSNAGSNNVKIFCRVDNPGADGVNHCVTDSISLSPGEANDLIIYLNVTPWQLSHPLKLIGMRGHPVHFDKIDPAKVNQILFFVVNPREKHRFRISVLRTGGQVRVLDADKFIPFIDEFGQFIHADWPGKTHSLQELELQVTKEDRDLKDYPGPRDRDRYGGWTAGPKLKTTGFFRTTKYRGKWWLVDPEGYLFWSHGIDCVGPYDATPVSDRENYFRNLPGKNSPLGQFYGSGTWAPHGYYSSHSPYKTYDFSQANLLRKYGSNWFSRYAEVTHRRLRSWGMNTIANWSDSRIYRMRQTPYTVEATFYAPSIAGSTGYWGKFFDVFDPAFRENCRKRMKDIKLTSANDPWCLGYFIHNELGWGDELSLALATLASPAKQPAKKVFINDLKAKYRDIGKLNQQWQSQYKSWDDLLQSTVKPDAKKAYNDLAAFYDKIADTYFRIIHEELKKAAPRQLYFGCRFAWVNPRAARAAAKYCDVVCYNRYTYSVAQHHLPDNIDKPIIVGEFHFGALDRGLFHTGLKRTLDQEDRARAYRKYVRGALSNPYIVGTHWFQYKDQPTTGRADGEDYQIGFLDICDHPYPEIVRAAREVGYSMYKYRLNN